MFDPITTVAALLIVLPAFFLVLTQSTYAADYAIFVVAFNRLVRRIVDYNNGAFNNYSLISLTPAVVCGFMVLGFVVASNRKPIAERFVSTKVVRVYAIAVAFAFVIGILRNRLAAVHALGDYLAPIGLLGYGILACQEPGVIDRWCRSIAVACVGVAVYGIWQFYTIPPWDGFWLVQAGMSGYMGEPEPMKMTLFSTMQERGPVAGFLVSGMFVLLFRQGQPIFKWPAVICILIAILLTSVRTTMVQFAIALMIFPLINQNVSIVRTAFAAILLTAITSNVIEYVPGFGRVSDRLATLGDLPNDGSVQGRIYLFYYAAINAFGEPFGTGLGSMGLSSSRIAGGSTAIGDSSGYMSLLQTFGWIGFILICLMMWRIWKSTGDVLRQESDNQNIMLLRAWFISGVAAFMAGDWLFTASFFWIVAGYCLGLSDAYAISAREVDEIDELDDWDMQYQHPSLHAS
jgi:hypothetical protein